MGNVATAVDLSGYITGVILIIMYTVTLVHACRGSRFFLVILLVSLLIASNVGLILGDWTNTELYIKGHTQSWMVWLMGLSQPLWLTTFNVAHFLLGWQYRWLAFEIPIILQGSEASREVVSK
jgi:hypothetical protein